MSSNQKLTYGSYLQLDKLLDAQHLQSAKFGEPAHHELFFIIIHQTYELWFKQIIFELDAIIRGIVKAKRKKSVPVDILNGLRRINKIQALLNEHLPVLETLSSADFLTFRDLLTPASGFQSVQFRLIEIRLGLYDKRDLTEFSFYKHFSEKQQQQLLSTQKQTSLFEAMQQWLESLFNTAKEFFKNYQLEVEKKLEKRQAQINQNKKNSATDIQLEQLQSMSDSFRKIFNEDDYNKQGGRLSYEAFISALFFYNNQQQTGTGYELLQAIIENDELLATWRHRHSLMVQRIIGGKVGTGGTSGYKYLRGTVEANRIFSEYTQLSSYLISDIYVGY
jgi:tryptophan 2,3-dioxygenase